MDEGTAALANIIWHIMTFCAFLTFQAFGWYYMVGGWWSSWDLIGKAFFLWGVSVVCLVACFVPEFVADKK